MVPTVEQAMAMDLEVVSVSAVEAELAPEVVSVLAVEVESVLVVDKPLVVEATL